MAKSKTSKNKEKSNHDNTLHLDMEQLKSRLIQNDNYIVSLIDTIPPKIYFDQEVQEKLIADKHAVMDEIAKTLKRPHSGQSDLSAKSKHKRARLDPLQHKSVSQIQQEYENEKAPKHKKVTFASSALNRASDVSELQKRLEEKIRALKAKRNCCSESESQEKKKLERKMKKMKKKNKKKGNVNKIIKDEMNKDSAVSPAVKLPKKLPPKPIFNKDGKVIYSKFDFGDGDMASKGRKKRTGKNKLKKLIEDAERDKVKVENLKTEDSEKAAALIEKKAWQRALEKAEGIKQKDDPVALKRSLKKIEKQKGQSNKDWKSRKENVEKKQKLKQEKRSKNIKAKKQEKLDKKIKRAKKKGRIIPGF